MAKDKKRSVITPHNVTKLLFYIITCPLWPATLHPAPLSKLKSTLDLVLESLSISGRHIEYWTFFVDIIQVSIIFADAKNNKSIWGESYLVCTQYQFLSDNPLTNPISCIC